jgi:rubrerythrin
MSERGKRAFALTKEVSLTAMKDSTFEANPEALEDKSVSDELGRNLAQAFAEESKGAVRNKAYALKAEKEGHPEWASLLKAVANAKSVHARRFLNLLRGKIGTTKENLRTAVENEIRATRKMYPPMVQKAKGSVKAVKKAFIQSNRTDEEHTVLLEKTMEDGDAKKEAVYYVCQICGHIHLGVVPDNCPICKAVPGRFKKVE